MKKFTELKKSKVKRDVRIIAAPCSETTGRFKGDA